MDCPFARQRAHLLRGWLSSGRLSRLRPHGRGSGEVAGNAEGLYFDSTRKLVGVTQGCRVDEGKRRTVVIRLILPGDLFPIEGASDLEILALRITASGDFAFGHYELTDLVVFVSGDVGMDGPLTRHSAHLP